MKDNFIDELLDYFINLDMKVNRLSYNIVYQILKYRYNGIYKYRELEESSTNKKFLLVQKEGTREVKGNILNSKQNAKGNRLSSSYLAIEVLGGDVLTQWLE